LRNVGDGEAAGVYRMVSLSRNPYCLRKNGSSFVKRDT